MGNKGMNKELSDFVKIRYPDSKSDLFAVFMERTLELTKSHGFMSMINQHSWMFLSSYEKLRIKIIEKQRIDTMVHLGSRAFEEIGGEVVQSVAFVLEKTE
jgi:type II restriction/modification system DNA methylase subunit YeeA